MPKKSFGSWAALPAKEALAKLQESTGFELQEEQRSKFLSSFKATLQRKGQKLITHDTLANALETALAAVEDTRSKLQVAIEHKGEMTAQQTTEFETLFNQKQQAKKENQKLKKLAKKQKVANSKLAQGNKRIAKALAAEAQEAKLEATEE